MLIVVSASHQSSEAVEKMQNNGPIDPNISLILSALISCMVIPFPPHCCPMMIIPCVFDPVDTRAAVSQSDSPTGNGGEQPALAVSMMTGAR